MARRRFIQLPDGSLVEVGGSYVPPLRADSGALWGDAHYDGLRATDGTPIDTRTKHREYMRRNGLTTADDFQGEWARAQALRDQHGRAHDPTRREDVARALERLRG